MSKVDNEISYSHDNVFVIKRGRNEEAVQKILRQKQWYDNAEKINPAFCGVIPKSFLVDKSLYMTNERGILLSDLLQINERITFWKSIIKQLVETYTTYFFRPLNDTSKSDYLLDNIDKANDEMFIKSIEKEIFDELPFELTKEKRTYLNNKLKVLYISKIVDNRKLITKIMHGNLHLDNIIFSFNLSNMRFFFISPRGMFGSDPNRFMFNCFGNIIYDIAKLCSDFFGRYSFLNLTTKPTKDDEKMLDELGTYMIEQFKEQLDCLKDFTLEDFIFLGRLFVLKTVPAYYKESDVRAKFMFNYIIEKI